MPEQLEPRYDHLKTEEKIYRLWEESGFFDPDRLEKAYSKWHRANKKNQNKKPSAIGHKPFAIIMPPPNANGSLHIGHAVGVTLQDIMVRFARMRGKKTLWLPGADHAGFETQVVFDKKLDKEGRNSDALHGRSSDTEGRRSRFTMSREELWKEIWEFTQKNKKVMEDQLRNLGASCDWSREKFTLDPEIIKTVYETFEKLYKDGLVYRDLRVINWCPKHKTALSDLEVKYVEREDPLYHIKYGPLTLATVRPETKFGDTALAVNPKDKRYQKYIGKEIEAQGILGPLKFKVIADDAIDPKFGTGVVKVTPAHDPLDFEIWQRHKSEIPGPKIIIDESGKLTGEVGEFKGLKVAEAREKVAERMKELGILEKVDQNYNHQVATCYKCGNTLEPLPKPQWFIAMTKPPRQMANGKWQMAKKSLRDLGVDAVKSGKIKIYPKRTEKVYMHWLKNIRDWNISRQIVWGIRIPAWFCLGCGEPKINPQIQSRWFLIRHGETDWNKEKRFMGQENVPLNQKGIEQAEQTAQRLRDRNIDLIISSDLLRAEQTARILAQKTGAEIVIDKNLRELHAGESQGLTYDEIAKQHNLANWDDRINQDFRFIGGESWDELEKRVWATFQHHIAHHNHKNVALVTHGGVIRIFQKNLHNIPLEKTTLLNNAGITEFSLTNPCKKCGSRFYEQDPDVFDTWFSSGQWPYATLMSRASSKSQAPNSRQKSDFDEFYPTDVMETGYDILFFWVARMIMLGLYRTGKVPFKNVYLHGLVRDKDRQKMSKSKGNVVDPLGVAEMYGVDALRMALVVGNTPGNDIVISEDKIRGYRNFATKIWNASRFVLMHKPADLRGTNTDSRGKNARKSALSKEDKKNIAGAIKTKAVVAKHIEKFEFHLAAEKAYHYFWHTFADKIIEETKLRLQNGTPEEKAAAYSGLETILRECLVMLHPFMPFITEEIHRKLEPNKLLLVQKW